MRLLRNSFVLIAMATTLVACGTTKGVTPQKQTVCSSVVEPPREPLANFTFYPLPAGSVAPDGTKLVGGLTADGITDVLGNHQKLQRREEKWQTRAKAVNDCLAQEVKDRK